MDDAAFKVKSVDEGGSDFSLCVSAASIEEDDFPDNQVEAAQSEEESLALFDGEFGYAGRFYMTNQTERGWSGYFTK